MALFWLCLCEVLMATRARWWLGMVSVSVLLGLGVWGAQAEDSPEDFVEAVDEVTETADASRSKLPTKTPPGMVRITGGKFWMGCNTDLDKACATDEQPPHEVDLDNFAIDKYEVPMHHYKGCVDSGICAAPIAHDPAHAVYKDCLWGRADVSQHPVNCVNWGQAWTYCNWAYKRLPTEAEWEKAARWIDARIYPWGSSPEPSCEFTVMHDPKAGSRGCGFDGPTTIHRAKEASPYGVSDMSGNLREWVWDVYQPDYFRIGPSKNPTGPARLKGTKDAPPSRVVKGGHYEDTAAWRLRISRRDFYQPDYISPTLGFRCARGLR